MKESMEIFWTDFTPEAHQRILEFFSIEHPKEANWDVFPVTCIVSDEGESILGDEPLY
jgi:hypothetical protein